MTKTKQWKITLIVLCAVLALALVTTILLSVNLPDKAAVAEAVVLDGNTAKYTFENDPAEQSLWTYNRTTNEWTSAAKKSSVGQPADLSKSNILKLKVTQAGNIVFKYKIPNVDSIAVAVKHYKNVVDDNLNEAEFTYVLNRGYKSSQSKFDIVFDENDPSFQVVGVADRTYADPITITDCEVGDVIAILVASTDFSRRNFSVQGLNVPDNQFNIVAKIAEGQSDFGTIKGEKEGETFVDGSLTVKRGYDESVTFEAVPQEGYYAYWVDQSETIVGNTAKLTVSKIDDSYDNAVYTVHFITQDEMKPVSGEKEEGQKYFNVDESGKASLDFGVSLSNDHPNLLFGFVIPEGGGYLELDYTYYSAKPLNAVDLYISGKHQDGNSNDGVFNKRAFFVARVRNIEGTEKQSSKYLQWISAPGYYEAEIKIQMGSYVYTEGDEFSIDSIKTIQTLTDFVDFTVDYNSELSEMTMKYDGAEEVAIEAGKTVQVPVGLTNINFTAKRKQTQKTSSLDADEMVNYYISSITGDKFSRIQISGEDKSTQKWVGVKVLNYTSGGKTLSTYMTFFGQNLMMFGNGGTYNPFPGGGGENDVPYTYDGTAQIKISYMEEAPLAVKATRMTDGQGDDISIENGKFVGVPFGHENSLTLSIKRMEGITKDDITFLVDGVEKKSELQELENVFVFAFSVVQKTNIQIKYTKADGEYIYSLCEFNITVGPSVDGDIDKLINHTSKDIGATLQITNDGTWEFDSNLSVEGNYAFSVAFKPQTYIANNLVFVMTGAESGSLTFQFRAEGVYLTSIYAFRCGQLWYGNRPFDGNDAGTCGISGDGTSYQDIEGCNWLARPKTAVGAGMEYNTGIIALEDGWYQASIPIKGDTPLYIGFLTTMLGFGAPSQTVSAAFRDVKLIIGEREVTLKLNSDAGEGSSAKATVNDNPYTVNSVGESAKFNIAAGGLLTLSATPKDGEVFYGWAVNGMLVSTDETTNIMINDESEIIAFIAPEHTYVARTEGIFHKTVEEAVQHASAGQNVYVIQDNVNITKSFTIESGVTLLLPYSDENKLTARGDQNRIAWINDAETYRYFTLTVKSGVVITIKGTLQVGGVTNCPGQGYQGHTSGAYSELILEKNSKIQVENGGVMDIYGRVWGGEGHSGEEMGTIEVLNGGKVFEPFLILDFAGGSNAFNIFMSDDPKTPFKRYAMINIECPITVNYGGELLGHATLYALNMFFSIDQPFISLQKEGEIDTFVMLRENSKVTITYDPTSIVENSQSNCTEGIGKTKMKFEGGAIFSYMIFSAMGFSVPTNSVYFSIPYNFDVELNGVGAQYETKTDFMIMPGATVTVGKDATLTLNANAWIYDGYQNTDLAGKSYPTADLLKAKGYPQNGNLIIDGKLIIGKKITVRKFEIFGSSGEFVPQEVPATFLGIVQTNGTGKIEIPEETILSGKIRDGVADTAFYFEYQTTARVWDAAHNCFGTLVAGHTYTATGDTEFNLEALQYTTSPSGRPDTTLDLTDQTLHGSWKIDHEDHVFDWSYAEGDTLPDGSTKHTQITRYCTEMGCDGHETRELVFTPESWGNITFTGKPLTDDDLKPIINKLFGDDYDLFEKAGGSLSYGAIKDVNNAGYDVKVTLSKGFFVSEHNYNGELTRKITVVKATLQDGDVQVNTDEVTYTGEAITKQVVVTYNGVTLAEHTDYLVDWGDDNTNVGEVTITVTGTGTNFEGTVTKTFRIVARSVSDASVVYEREKEYTGDQIQPSVTSVTVNNKLLTAQTDYTVEYGANLDKGTGTVTIKGNGNYNGEKQLEFNILAKNMSGAKVTVDGEYTFDGQKQEPKVTVSLDGFNKQLNKDTDYDLSFGESDLIKAGQVTVTATFKGNYEGSAQGTFEIKQKDIAEDLTFEGVENSYTYTGKAIQPTVTVKFDQVDLTKDDFDVVYGTNTAVAEQGTVTVKGKGNYTGTKEFTFTITPADASQAQVKVNGSYTYNAQAQDVQVTVTLANFAVTSSDYTIEYGNSDRTNAGTVNFTVKFKGNFSGSVEQSFEIGKAQVKVTPNNAESPQGEAQVQLSYRIDGTMYGDDLNTLKSVLTVKLANDENVSEAKAGKTFDIVVTLGETELTKNYNIDVSAKGTYTITEAVFKDVAVADVTVDYDGKTHPVSAQNLPDGAKATYVYKQGDSAIEGEPKDAGNYNVTITVTMGSYKPFVFNRTVTITAKKLTVTLHKQSVVFNTKEQHASSDKQYWSVEGVVDGESVTLTIAGSLTNVGSANLTATPVAGENTKLTNYSVDSAQLTLKDGFTVEQKDIAGLTFGGVNESYTYTGKAIQPTVTVKFEQVNLTEDDFDVVYGANTAVAEQGTVTVKGKGNYTGSKQFTFAITPADASQAQVKVNGSYTYNAQAQSVQVTVTLANFAVTSSDYTIEYGNSDRTNAGTVKFTVQFKGNFSGSVSSQFEIGKATVTEITVNEGTSFTYDGEEQQLTFVVKAGVLTLSTGDYDLSNDREDDLTNAGAVNFTAKGKGNFQGEKSVTVTIARAQLTQVTVQNKDSHVYNGKQQQVELEVKAGDLTANVNDDYTVNYQGNLTNAGTVTVTVTGKGNFQGEVSDEFVIAKAEIGISVEDKNSVYGYETVALTYVATGIAEEDKTSVLMDAYVTLSCSASAQSDADEYDITATVSDSVSELANYTVRVTRQGTYTVNARPLTVTIRDQQNVYGYNKTYDFDLMAWDITSGELVEGDELHFTLVQPQFDGAGDYNITVTESDLDGNYTLTFEGSNGTAGKYSISKLDVSDSAVFYVTSGDMQVDDNGVVKLDGDAVEFTGGATVMEDKLKELKVSIDPQSIDSTGEHTLTLTIEDKNYSGSKSYSITVIDGDMSAELYKALRDLEALTGDMQPNELETKQEHYELVKGVRGILDGLSDEVWDEGEEELSFYQEFVDVWDNSADVDDNIVQTAKAIADAPIKGLFVVATLNALLAVAYAIAKGGIL